VSQKAGLSSALRVTVLSAFSAFAAPLVFVGVIGLRKISRRGKVQFRQLNKRMQHEIARWT
jgi:hypothetical protein